MCFFGGGSAGGWIHTTSNNITSLLISNVQLCCFSLQSSQYTHKDGNKQLVKLSFISNLLITGIIKFNRDNNTKRKIYTVILNQNKDYHDANYIVI